MKVFVFYSRHLDVEKWERLHRDGLTPDLSPYGYHHAEADGCTLTYSRPSPDKGMVGLAGRILRGIFKFDLVHAWNNRAHLFDPSFDVIWTHTEREHLAVAFLRLLLAKPTAPVVAQSVWLIDDWRRLSWLRRAFFRSLLRKLEVLTFLSTANQGYAQRLKLNERIETVVFGISASSFPMQPPRETLRHPGEIRVLAIGNDRHRDWRTLTEALADLTGVKVRILSRNFPKALLHSNMSLETARQDGVLAAYDWADCVVVPVTDNLHASGLTVALEATALGLPVIATRTGGMQMYFGEEDIRYVDVADSASLRAAVLGVGDRSSAERVVRAQNRFRNQDFTTQGYASRHVGLSRRLLATPKDAKSKMSLTKGLSIAARRLLRRRLGLWPVMEFRNKLIAAPKLPILTSFENREVRRLRPTDVALPQARVACIIPTYRRPEGVVTAIRSILAQSFQDFVIVVVDDGAGLPELPQDPRILAVSLSRNTAVLGLVRNVGIRLSQSEFIAFLDDDNTWTPHHLAVSVAALEQGADLVYTAVRRRLPNGEELDVLSRSFDRRSFADDVSFLDANSVVLRRSACKLFSRVPRTKATMPKEDWEFVWRVSQSAKVKHIPLPTVEYLVNPGSFYTAWAPEVAEA
jgi:glycosyltransferase involved in cell wall biosynthesis